MTLQRILYSVPHLPHVRWEIAKAIQTLAATENWHLEQDDELAKVQSHRELMAEIVRDAWRILGKSGYDPHEPRVPAGNPDGGQWTNGGSNSFSNDRGIVSDRAPDRGTRSDYQYAANSPPGIGHNQGPPLEDPPEIPPRPPAKIGTFIKAAAYWIASAIAQADKRVALFLAAILAAGWIAGRYYKYITTYQDPPKTLEELQQNWGPGYDQHHIVEQWSEKDGIPRSKIDSSENVVPIPTLKHWQINSWLGTPTPEFTDADGNEMTPREYMKGKTWEERYQFDLGVLRRFGVLKP